jgi:hypothetical protein
VAFSRGGSGVTGSVEKADLHFAFEQFFECEMLSVHSIHP